jgi:hypothetical protein
MCTTTACCLMTIEKISFTTLARLGHENAVMKGSGFDAGRKRLRHDSNFFSLDGAVERWLYRLFAGGLLLAVEICTSGSADKERLEP